MERISEHSVLHSEPGKAFPALVTLQVPALLPEHRENSGSAAGWNIHHQQPSWAVLLPCAPLTHTRRWSTSRHCTGTWQPQQSSPGTPWQEGNSSGALRNTCKHQLLSPSQQNSGWKSSPSFNSLTSPPTLTYNVKSSSAAWQVWATITLSLWSVRYHWKVTGVQNQQLPLICISKPLCHCPRRWELNTYTGNFNSVWAARHTHTTFFKSLAAPKLLLRASLLPRDCITLLKNKQRTPHSDLPREHSGLLSAPSRRCCWGIPQHLWTSCGHKGVSFSKNKIRQK